jgi:proline iminopeptidase
VGEATGNTTQQLIADIELLRKYLDVSRWLLFGGSWGSTLALAYGQAHPGRCLGFVLRGIFLGRPSEIEWFLYGLRNVCPEAWQRFAAMLPAAERGDLLRGI